MTPKINPKLSPIPFGGCVGIWLLLLWLWTAAWAAQPAGLPSAGSQPTMSQPVVTADLVKPARVPKPAVLKTPEQVADRVAQDWIAGKLNPTSNLNLKTDADLEAFTQKLLRFSPAPTDTRINLKLREKQALDAQGRQVYRYPVSVNGQEYQLQVRLIQDAQKNWQAYSVRLSPENIGIPPQLVTPIAAWLFIIGSVAWGVLCWRSPYVRQLIKAQWAIVVEQRWVYIWVNVVLYGSFILGAWYAYISPKMALEIQDYMGSAIASINLQDALKGGIHSSALAILYWNFTSGVILTTYIPGLIFGFPAAIFNALRFLLLGVALSPAVIPVVTFWWHVPTILIELQAYIFVAASAVAMVFRGFKVGWMVALQGYLFSLGVAFTLLLIAAWYEAIEILWILPMFAGK